MCANAGADALGFIFAPISKRLVSVQVAREASLAVGPAVSRVGVFLNQGLDEVLRTAEAAKMSAVQLHGPLRGLYVEAVAAYYPVLRVLRPADLLHGQQNKQAGHVDPSEIGHCEIGHCEIGHCESNWADNPAITLMIDAPEAGGGIPLDWEALKPNFPKRAWLAGGLGPANVAEAIRILCPAGVDAVSRLEARAGIKDPQSIKSFIEAVDQAF